MKRFFIGGKYEYCPNGNYWSEVSGIFDKQIYLFCECDKCSGQVYVLKPFNVTKKINKDAIKRFKENLKLEEVRSEVTRENMDKVKKIIEDSKF